MDGLREELEALLRKVADGEVLPEEALDRFASLPALALGDANVDAHRELRQGAPEAVLAEGKTPEQVARIALALHQAGAASVLVTRADEAARAAVREVLPSAEEHEAARAIWVRREGSTATDEAEAESVGIVTMVSGGTSDGPALHEARIRAELLGACVLAHEDVGVAGLHRLLRALPDLRAADCVVVAAGMDAALASVVGGLVEAPVIGIPTSTGYGSAHGGETARDAMLTSCAAGLAVVGIDDGFGAGTIAAAIARSAVRAPSGVYEMKEG